MIRINDADRYSEHVGMEAVYEQDAQLSQRDRLQGALVLAKSGYCILRTLYVYL